MFAVNSIDMQQRLSQRQLRLQLAMCARAQLSFVHLAIFVHVDLAY
jgi:hypothetical protein